LPPNKPVVGEHTFLHESELHAMGAIEAEKFWMCFTPYKPECVGQKERIIFGPTTLHGEAIRKMCEAMNLKNFEESIPEILKELRLKIARDKFATKEELIEFIHKYVER